MKKIGLIVKLASPEAVRTGGDVAAWLNERGATVYCDPELAKHLSGVEAVQATALAEHIEALVVLGGDGMMLYAARLIAGKAIPILGVNLGGLGFLTSITVGEVYTLLEKVMANEFETEERMLLRVEIFRAGELKASYKVLNDAVIKGATTRLIMMETRINREYVTTYRADGLIVATPTGSTAYSLSTAGPILYPTIHSIIVAPICPFNLTNRPVVIPDWMRVDVTLKSENVRVNLTLDGQVDVELEAGDTVGVRRADESVNLVKYGDKGYFDILRERLMWELKPGGS